MGDESNAAGQIWPELLKILWFIFFALLTWLMLSWVAFGVLYVAGIFGVQIQMNDWLFVLLLPALLSYGLQEKWGLATKDIPWWIGVAILALIYFAIRMAFMISVLHERIASLESKIRKDY